MPAIWSTIGIALLVAILATTGSRPVVRAAVVTLVSGIGLVSADAGGVHLIANANYWTVIALSSAWFGALTYVMGTAMQRGSTTRSS